MNTKLVNTAADVILRALTQNRTAAGIALALESTQMLQSPETAAELERLRTSLKDAAEQVAKLESDLGGATARVAELESRLAEYERPADEDPIGFVLPETAGGLTDAELALTPDGTYRCKCGHWDNVHGPFCFAAVCECGQFELAAERQQTGGAR